MNMLKPLFVACTLTASAAFAAPPTASVKLGDDVDVTSGAVTALSCALEARDRAKLEAVNACPLDEAAKGIVIFDVAEKQIYLLDKRKVRTSQLERAFGGGSVDFSGKVRGVAKNGVATIVVEELSVTPRPKPGASKACL